MLSNVFELTTMWIGSVVTIFLYTQLSVITGWMLIHYRSISTNRELFDTICIFIVSILYIIVQICWTLRGLVYCQGAIMEIASTIVSLGLGLYIHRSLERRHSFYLFIAQEERKHNAKATETP